MIYVMNTNNKFKLSSIITLVNTHFGAKKVLTVLRYFWVVETENDINFSELALDFEIFHIFVSKSAKNTQILT